MVLREKRGLRELALFAGAGGGILGGLLHGWRTVAAVEIEDYPRRVLLQRQADGILPRFPIWDDVCTFDGKPWRGKVDVVSGGFPCQDISAAGKGAGIEGERSGLWKEMARIIGEVRPRYAFMENSPMLISRGLTTVLGDLAEMGQDAEWCIVGAVDVGANHARKRIWILSDRWETLPDACEIMCTAGRKYSQRKTGSVSYKCRPWQSLAYSSGIGLQGCCEIGVGEQEKEREQSRKKIERDACYQMSDGSWWDTEPNVGRVANGVADRVDRLKAIGNGQVPAVAALAWQILTQGE
jgi:DNA (cytosine-5)-methyltransferase 1